MLENLSSKNSLAERIGQDATVLPWILSRIQQKESPVSQNKQYAAEILAILLQSASKNREKFIGLEGIDLILQLLSQYRKRDPEKDSHEEEYVENLFDSLICLVDEVSGKEKFIDAEGIELAQIMLKEAKFSKPRALRVLDHAFGGVSGAAACERLVEVAGLRTVFGMFMKKARLPDIYTKAFLTSCSKRAKTSNTFLASSHRFCDFCLVDRQRAFGRSPNSWRRNMKKSKN